jgi:tRNA-splicing ligase RtcB (3'-phosphate/5'-hydroxy nucleic acid ligase)
MRELASNLRSWASEIDDKTVEQALVASRLPILAGPIALMPDAHLGIGATVGSVIPTDSAIIPSAVGVDIGCGMIAVETNRRAEDIPEPSLDRLLQGFAQNIPAGLGNWHRSADDAARRWLSRHPNASLTAEQQERALVQFGTLGSGNHFVELAVDERGLAWLVMHSGSRGVGNQLADKHIRLAKAQAQGLEDPDLAYFVQGTPAFDAYVRDMLWAQDYAAANRTALMQAALLRFNQVAAGSAVTWINCHHNYAALERYDGRDIWVTRKGAIRAETGDLGVIPGSMGSKSFIVRGLGNPLSYRSSSHGAGRRMSRTQARREVSVEAFKNAMAGRTWQATEAATLVDESPQAYKDIDRVMADQADLVEIVHELRGLLSYKGVERRRVSARRPRAPRPRAGPSG